MRKLTCDSCGDCGIFSAGILSLKCTTATFFLSCLPPTAGQLAQNRTRRATQLQEAAFTLAGVAGPDLDLGRRHHNRRWPRACRCARGAASRTWRTEPPPPAAALGGWPAALFGPSGPGHSRTALEARLVHVHSCANNFGAQSAGCQALGSGDGDADDLLRGSLRVKTVCVFVDLCLSVTCAIATFVSEAYVYLSLNRLRWSMLCLVKNAVRLLSF